MVSTMVSLTVVREADFVYPQGPLPTFGSSFESWALGTLDGHFALGL